MAISKDDPIYDDVSFATLCKKVVVNSDDKRNQLDILISDLKTMIKTPNDAIIIVPLLRNYYDMSIKNDDQLVKISAIVQRLMSDTGNSDGVPAEGYGTISEEEKQALMEIAEEMAKQSAETCKAELLMAKKIVNPEK